MLNPEAYRQLIRTMGEQFEWLRAIPATSYDPRTSYDELALDGQADHGYYYRSEGIKRGLVQQQKRDMLHPQLGWIYAGQLWLTVMPDECRINTFDKVVLLERSQTQRERITKGEDQLGHPYAYEVVLVADADRTYVEGEDWAWDGENRRIVWLPDGQSPADGAVYAVEYRYRPIYWFVGSDMREARPIPGYRDVVTPIRGLLTLAPPEV